MMDANLGGDAESLEALVVGDPAIERRIDEVGNSNSKRSGEVRSRAESQANKFSPAGTVLIRALVSEFKSASVLISGYLVRRYALSGCNSRLHIA